MSQFKYRDAAGLAEHYASSHFPCNEGDCADSLVVFASETDLKAHRLERHSSKMPRFKRCVCVGGGARVCVCV